MKSSLCPGESPCRESPSQELESSTRSMVCPASSINHRHHQRVRRCGSELEQLREEGHLNGRGPPRLSPCGRGFGVCAPEWWWKTLNRDGARWPFVGFRSIRLHDTPGGTLQVHGRAVRTDWQIANCARARSKRHSITGTHTRRVVCSRR